MQKYDIEYCTYDWGRLVNVMSNLLKDSYVCRIATKENLYTLDAIETNACAYEENGITCYNADRNRTVFMNRDTFEKNYIGLPKEDKENV